MSVSYIASRAEDLGGFNFDNLKRNALLQTRLQAAGRSNGGLPSAKKTGTTICGVKCANVVVLGADTRATEDTIVADKNCQKLHFLADNVYCAGAGTAADLEHTCDLMASKLELHRLNTATQPRVASCVSMLSQMLFKYGGHVSCALVIGGVDVNGPQLYKVFPHGSSDRLPFSAMGSGCLCAEGELEAGFKDDMTEEEGIALVTRAIRSGILNDLGSGGYVDVIVIRKDSATLLRNRVDPSAALRTHPKGRPFAAGTTPILMEKIKQIKDLVEVEEVEEVDEDVEM